MKGSNLTSKQRGHLRSLAHALKPIVHVGKEGVTEAVVQAVGEAFRTRELVKGRVLDTAPEEPREAAELLAERFEGAAVVHVLGRTFVLYRPDPDRPKIELPA